MSKGLKTIIWIVVIALIVWGIYSISNRDDIGTTGEPIKIGVVIPLTGVRAEGGAYDKKGLDLALEEINSDIDNKYKIDLIYEDSQYDPAMGVTAFHKLKDVDKVKYVIGAHGSSVTLAMAPIAEENKIILVTPVSQALDITNAGDYIFRTQINVSLEAPFLADFIYQKAQDKPVHLLILNTDYGKSFIEHFQPYYENLGGQMGVIDEFNKEDLDLRTQLTKIKSEDNDEYIIIASVPKHAAMVMKQAREMGMESQFFATAPVEGQDLLDIGGVAVENLIFSSAYDNWSENSAMKSYREKYSEEYNELNEMYSASCYDTLHILSDCFEKVGDNVEKVKQCLYKLKDYQGASGILTIDKNGDVSKPFIMKTVKNGEFMPYNE